MFKTINNQTKFTMQANFVVLRRFELLTLGSSDQCSTNWATAPTTRKQHNQWANIDSGE